MSPWLMATQIGGMGLDFRPHDKVEFDIYLIFIRDYEKVMMNHE